MPIASNTILVSMAQAAMLVCLSVCVFVCLSVCLFVCLSVCLFVCLSVCLFVFDCLVGCLVGWLVFLCLPMAFVLHRSGRFVWVWVCLFLCVLCFYVGWLAG